MDFQTFADIIDRSHINQLQRTSDHEIDRYPQPKWLPEYHIRPCSVQLINPYKLANITYKKFCTRNGKFPRIRFSHGNEISSEFFKRKKTWSARFDGKYSLQCWDFSSLIVIHEVVVLSQDSKLFWEHDIIFCVLFSRFFKSTNSLRFGAKLSIKLIWYLGLGSRPKKASAALEPKFWKRLTTSHAQWKVSDAYKKVSIWFFFQSRGDSR